MKKKRFIISVITMIMMTAMLMPMVAFAAIPVTTLTLSHDSIRLELHRVSGLVVTIGPSGATNTTIIWTSSDESVATVTDYGMVRGVGEGTATISATSPDGPSASCEVTVDVAVTGIDLTVDSVFIYLGEKYQFNPIISPSNATNKTLIWTTTDESIATIDENGLVTTLREGGVWITATSESDPTVSDKCRISTRELVPVTSVAVSDETLTIESGQTGQLSATVEPFNADNKTVTWTSSNETVATVDEFGVVTAVAAGTANITVTTHDGGFTDTCVVTVPICVTGVEITPSTSTISVGGTVVLSAVVSPSNAPNQNVTWRCWDPWIASLSDEGVVTGVSPGTASFMVTSEDGGFTGRCTVTVTSGGGGGGSGSVSVTGVEVAPQTASVSVGDTTILGAMISPSDASNKTVTWVSSNTSVATVNSSGVVTGVSEGISTITATTEDGGFTNTCTVTVDDTSAATGTITGQILDVNGVPYVGSVVLNSTPVTAVLDSEGRFRFENAALTVHRLDILDSGDQLVGEFFLDFSEGTNESHQTDEKKVDITYSPSTLLINLDLALDADENVVLNKVTFEQKEGNPQTGKRDIEILMYALGCLALVCLGCAWSCNKRFGCK